MAAREQPLLRRTPFYGQFVRTLPQIISPSRLALAVIVAAFVLAMVWIQQTQSLVRVGGELQRLEDELGQLELQRQDLLAELALLDDLPTVQRTAFTALGMRRPDAPSYLRAGPLPPGVSFDLPLWAAPTAPLQATPWWEAFLRAVSAKLSSLRE